MLLANFNRKEHLRHRAVSLRQHGFLVKGSGEKKLNKEFSDKGWALNSLNKLLIYLNIFAPLSCIVLPFKA